MSNEEKKVLKFGEFEVTEAANGKDYSGKQEIALHYFKEKGFGKETVGKFFDTIHDIQVDAMKFCEERVCENKKDAYISLPVRQGVSIDAGVLMRRFYPDGIAKEDENGNKIKPGKKAHYGGIRMGMTFTATQKMADIVNSIATNVENACKAHCEKMDAEAAKAEAAK